ncbi:RHS repeat domain-containing protein [uncultured Psychroserpens sp.]|uniref:RHS repeat domain-containing protein n=1 Tax=uncultured Psychroserpens sp. TaxID=255436 RepID=UPI00260F4DEF|nr:RHS repeat domain-containing protein [uncultured Psychroserpens sp.]
MKNFVSSSMTIIMVMLCSMSYGQELPEIIPPSPTVANLMQFEEVPVSYYTGQPNISIPIYSKALNGDLAVNIGLSYNTQGVKINNISGWTGTGWSLNAGGVISRTVRGEPDEITPSNSSTIKTGIYHLDDYWNYASLSDPLKVKFNYLVIGDNGNKYDNKPDLYQFNFMGYSGRFVILKEGNTLVPEFISKTGKFKVEFNHNSDFEISDFTVTDMKGYIYTFDVVESSQTTPFTGSIAQGTSAGNVSASPKNYNYSANTAWHLSKVEASNGEDLVSFSYHNILENYVASASRTTSRISNAHLMTDYNGFVASSFNQGVLEPLQTVSYQNMSTYTKKIQNITFIRDNIRVLFDIKQGYPHPETDGAVLDKIRIEDANDINNIILNKTYQLSYQETVDNSLGSQNLLKRLWLTKVTETANTIDHDYILDYNDKQNLPGFNKDDIRGDSWGYYSGINVGSSGCSGSAYSEDIIRTGLLKSIEYPTGGVKEFVFEHNSYSYYQNQLIGANDYNENPRNWTTPNNPPSSFSHDNGQNPGGTEFIEIFTLNHEQDIFVSSTATSTPNGYLDDHRIRIHSNDVNNNVNYERFVELNQSCVQLTDLPAGIYRVTLVPSGSLTQDTYVIAGTFQSMYSNIITNPKQEMIGGGVRIKEVKFLNDPLNTTAEKSIMYDYNDEVNSSLSSGVVDSKADRLERQYTLNTNRWTYSDAGESPTSFIVRPINYDVVEKTVNVELTQGSYIGYRHVKVYETDNGFSTYAYTSPYEYASDNQVFDFTQPRPKENLDYKRGLLLRERTFNKDSLILKETSYLDDNNLPNYQFDEDVLFNDKTVYKPNCEWIFFYSEYGLWVNGTISNQYNFPGFQGPYPNCGAFPLDNADFKSGWAKLKGSTTKDFFYDGATTLVKESRQEFLYNSENYQISVQDSYYDEGGTEQHIETKYYYPVGATLGSNSLAIRNELVSLNKVNEVLETETFKNTIKLNETQNIYHEFTTDQVLPQTINVGKGSDAPEARITFHSYDSYGNPLEVSKADGIRIMYVWGYHDTRPIAKIVNHSYDNISAGLLAAINDAKTASNNDTNVANENILKTELDDLRNHTDLSNAQISTYTYDPLTGITSVKDARGYSMTYYYDAFNRLLHVKDQDGNILSENEYNYKNQY